MPYFIKDIGITRCFIWDVPFTTPHGFRVNKKSDLVIFSDFKKTDEENLRLLTYYETKEKYDKLLEDK